MGEVYPLPPPDPAAHLSRADRELRAFGHLDNLEGRVRTLELQAAVLESWRAQADDRASRYLPLIDHLAESRKVEEAVKAALDDDRAEHGERPWRRLNRLLVALTIANLALAIVAHLTAGG